MITNHQIQTNRSVLATLRTLMPARRTTGFTEAKRIAELQAAKFLELHGISTWPVPLERIIEQLPKIRIEYCEQPVSGATFWDSEQWVIQLNKYESKARQRFSLAHEYKHIVDHGSTNNLYATGSFGEAEQRCEQAADYFAACLLMPKPLLKREYFGGIQKPSELAALFGVSAVAAAIRLEQTGITSSNHPRCLPRTQWQQPVISFQGV